MYQKDKFQDKYLHLGHDIAKLNYKIIKFINRKLGKIGIPVSLGLIYFPLNEFIEKNTTTWNYTPYLMGGMVGFYCLNWLSSYMLVMEFYNIKFYHCGLIKGYQYINLSNIISLDKYTKQWLFKTNVPISNLKGNMDILECVLKSNIVDIDKYNNSHSMIKITTSTKVIDYKYLSKHGDSNLIRLQSAFKLNNIEIYNCRENIEDYKELINFDCDIRKSDILKVLPEIKHLTGINNFNLDSSYNSDFEIIINKPIPVINFYDLLMVHELDSKNNLILGMDSNSRTTVISVLDIYHSIVAGSTGYGKSNLGHVLVSSLLKSDIDIVTILLDPKKSELKRYRDIDNVFYSGDNIQIVKTLKYLEKEMDRRNLMFENDKFIKDIENWNKTNKQHQLPYIVCYIEEIADLILSQDKDIKETFIKTITRLTQLGRSSGFRFFLSTQSPKREILTTIIKSNCATRFGFGVTNESESRVILDNDKCKKLVKGEMILQTNGQEIKIKVPLLKDSDIKTIVSYLENYNKNASKPHSKIYVSTMSNILNKGVTTVSQQKETVSDGTVKEESDTIDIKYKIYSSNDLLEFYRQFHHDSGEILSLNDTTQYVSKGRTTIQKYRKELIENGSLIVKDQKTYIKDLYNKKAN